MARYTRLRPLALLVAAASVAFAAASPVSADPTVVPAAQDIVGVGDQTTGSLLDQFSTDYNAFLGTGSGLPHLYSWDATGSATIAVTKTGSVANIFRPDGTYPGVTALAAYTNTTVDFARTSRAPGPGGLPGLDSVPFARDGVSWAGNKTGNAPVNLTTADLKGIYTCTVTNWNQVTDIPGYTGPNATIKAYLPESGSGTRNVFLTAVNGGSSALTPGACVSSYSAQSEEGTDPVFADPDVVFPYSAGHYIGQLNGHVTATDAPGNLSIRSLNGVSPLTGTPATLNTVFTASSFGRVLFNVLRHSEFTGTGTQPTALRAIFGNAGWICFNATAKADIKSYGFQLIPSVACGS